eukprot:scaffold272518_cov30-Tisochrysis_lutea.AAC.9
MVVLKIILWREPGVAVALPIRTSLPLQASAPCVGGGIRASVIHGEWRSKKGLGGMARLKQHPRSPPQRGGDFL